METLIRRRLLKRAKSFDESVLGNNIKFEDVTKMTREQWLNHLEGYMNRPSIIWEMLIGKTRRNKDKPTLQEAAMEAETLLTNYLYNEHFPKGSDCEVVRDMLRRALRQREKIEKTVVVESTVPGLGTGRYSFTMVEDAGMPDGMIYMFPKGLANAINRGDARILKI